MWLSPKIVDFFKVSVETVQTLRTDLQTAQAEIAALKAQIQTSNITNDWLRTRVNQLELERTQLMQVAYNVKLPVPELVRPSTFKPDAPGDVFSLDFDDMGDDLAKKLGLPTYGKN
jgi:hypothetical protein